MSQEALEKAVENALGTMEAETKTENVGEVKEEKTSEPKQESKETEEESKLDERTTQALQLLEALEDPSRAVSVIQHLAKQAGLLSGEMTKKEEKQAIRGIKEVVKDRLGEDGAWIADKLGDALEEVIQGEVGKIEKRLEEAENQRQVRQFEQDYNAIIVKEKVSNEEAIALEKLVDKYPWNGKIPLSEYLPDLIEMHRSKAAKVSKASETKERQQKNIERQTRTQGVESNEDRIKSGSSKISAREAVLAALKGEQLD
jgi:hypothetical protein